MCTIRMQSKNHRKHSLAIINSPPRRDFFVSTQTHKRRSVHEWQSLTLLGIESNGLPGSGSHRGEGGGRANEGSEDSGVHG